MLASGFERRSHVFSAEKTDESVPSPRRATASREAREKFPPSPFELRENRDQCPNRLFFFKLCLLGFPNRAILPFIVMFRFVAKSGFVLNIVRNKEEASKKVARMIIDRVSKKPNLNLLVPTGTTPEGVYEELKKKPDFFHRVNFFNMDEYCEKVGTDFRLVSKKNSKGYRYYMWKNFFALVSPKASFFPSRADIKFSGSYDTLIKNLGGIDLCLGAVGEDGHMGFNFPGGNFDSKTRLVRLNVNIKKVNEKLTGYKIPLYGVTVGLRTISESKEIIFLVIGRRKAKILKKIVDLRQPDKKTPASILLSHKKCFWIADREAASLLSF